MSKHNFATGDCDTDSSKFERLEHLEGMSHISGKKKSKTKIIDELPIKQFSNDFCDNPAIVMIGKNKGNLQHIDIMHQLFESKKVDEFVVISPADKHLKLYTFIDKVYYEYKSEIIERLLQKQTNDKKNSSAKHIMIVLDDCFLLKDGWIKDHSLMELLFNGRHYNISYIWKMQLAKGVTSELRGNFDYIYFFYDDFISNLKRIYEYYAGMFPSFDSFRQVFTEITSNNDTLLIVNKNTSLTFFEKILYSKCVNNKKDTNLPSANLKYSSQPTENNNEQLTENNNEQPTENVKTTKENAILNTIAKSNCEIVKYISNGNCDDKLLNELLLKIALCNDSIVKLLTK